MLCSIAEYKLQMSLKLFIIPLIYIICHLGVDPQFYEWFAPIWLEIKQEG